MRTKLIGPIAAMAALCTITIAPTASAAPAAATNFYSLPATTPAIPGTLIRSEYEGGAPNIGVNTGEFFGTGTKIMYSTRNVHNKPTPVTGTFIKSSAPWSGKGPRPLISFAPGTYGQGDQCAESKLSKHFLEYTGTSMPVGYENPFIANLLGKGFNVVVTDYVGLGTPLMHTYMNRIDQGHAVIDAVRAARSVKGSGVTKATPVGFFGYSQGGGASASAAELQPTYGRDVNLKFAYAGAVPAELAQVAKTADGSAAMSVLAYVINGVTSEYPGTEALTKTLLNSAGQAWLKRASHQCITDSVATDAFKNTRQFTASGQPGINVIMSNPKLAAILNAQTIGNLRPTVPMYVLSNAHDDLVDHQQTVNMARKWCRKGVSVDFYTDPLPLIAKGSVLNHLYPAIADGPGAANWMFDRFNGKPAPNNCGKF